MFLYNRHQLFPNSHYVHHQIIIMCLWNRQIFVMNRKHDTQTTYKKKYLLPSFIFLKRDRDYEIWYYSDVYSFCLLCLAYLFEFCSFLGKIMFQMVVKGWCVLWTYKYHILITWYICQIVISAYINIWFAHEWIWNQGFDIDWIKDIVRNRV